MKGELTGRPLVVAFLGVCAGASGGFAWWNPLFALILVPALWRSRALIVLAVAVGVGWFVRPHPEPAIAVTGGVVSGVGQVIGSRRPFALACPRSWKSRGAAIACSFRLTLTSTVATGSG